MIFVLGNVTELKYSPTLLKSYFEVANFEAFFHPYIIVLTNNMFSELPKLEPLLRPKLLFNRGGARSRSLDFTLRDNGLKPNVTLRLMDLLCSNLLGELTVFSESYKIEVQKVLEMLFLLSRVLEIMDFLLSCYDWKSQAENWVKRCHQMFAHWHSVGLARYRELISVFKEALPLLLTVIGELKELAVRSSLVKVSLSSQSAPVCNTFVTPAFTAMYIPNWEAKRACELIMKHYRDYNTIINVLPLELGAQLSIYAQGPGIFNQYVRSCLRMETRESPVMPAYVVNEREEFISEVYRIGRCLLGYAQGDSLTFYCNLTEAPIPYNLVTLLTICKNRLKSRKTFKILTTTFEEK